MPKTIETEKVIQVIHDRMEKLQQGMKFDSQMIEAGGKYAEHFAETKARKLDAWIELYWVASELGLDQ